MGTQLRNDRRAPRKGREPDGEKASFLPHGSPAFSPGGQALRAGGVPPPCPGPARVFCIALVLRCLIAVQVSHAASCFVFIIRNALQAKQKHAALSFNALFTASFSTVVCIRINETPCEHSGKQVMFRYDALHAANILTASSSRFNETLCKCNWKCVLLLNGACTRQDILSQPVRRGTAAIGRQPEGLPSGERQNARSVGRACTHLGRAFGFRAAPASLNHTHKQQRHTTLRQSPTMFRSRGSRGFNPLVQGSGG